MSPRYHFHTLAQAATLLALAALLVAPVVCAQTSPAGSPTQEPTQQDPSESQEPSQPNPSSQPLPKPAGRETPIFTEYEEAHTQDQNTLKPDTTALTGVLVPTVGTSEIRHSYFVPGFQYGNFIQEIGSKQSGLEVGWNTTSFIAANLSLLKGWSHSQLAMNYSGGGSFSTDKTQGNGYFHQIGAAQSFTWLRWQLTFFDQFSYLPQTQFGFGAASTLAIPGVGGSLAAPLPGLQASYQPDQNVVAAIGTRYSNSITGELAYKVNPRTTLTLTGSYGLLRFVDPGNAYINSDDNVLSVGFERSLSKNNTIGLLYRYFDYRFLDQPQTIQDQVLQVAFGRKVTGRLAWQIFVGPDVTTFQQRSPDFSDRVSVAAGANVTYTLSRDHISVGYNHGVAGGSGVLTGAVADTLEGSFDRPLSRIWKGNVSFGYSKDASLASGNLATSALTFSSWFVGGGLDRSLLSRNANLSIAYSAYIDDRGQTGCIAAACSSDLRHQISLSLQWHARPFVLR
jgi:hypothetical protein